MRVEVRPELLQWARERAGMDVGALAKRFPNLRAWELGQAHPTFRQLEHFAKATHSPFGYFFLQEAPVESIPIPDLRTVGDKVSQRPSPDLLDTIFICQQRQEWYHDFARSTGERPHPYVGSETLASRVVPTAGKIRQSLGFDTEERRHMATWIEALRRFIGQADELGILVMVSGVVGSNNRRKLDPDEFRGFALADDLAPLVFVNGADTKSAQMFTLAHEIAHIWLGQSALSDVDPVLSPSHDIETWCNAVAAELLVPLAQVREEYRPDTELPTEVERLARCFKVSTLVVLRRIHDAGYLSQEQFWQAYEEELERLRLREKGNGGNFYLTLPVRVSKRFARAVVASTLEGQTLYREAFRLLGFSKLATFQELGRSLGVL